MSYCFVAKKHSVFPTLQEICSRVLGENKHILGDLGAVPISLFLPVLAHCTPDELTRIEDQTLKQSGRDIRSETWQIWKNHYHKRFGKPNPADIPPVPFNQTRQDQSLGNLLDVPGDYRLLYERKQQQRDLDRQMLSNRLKNIRKQEAISKEQRKAKRIDAVDLRKIKKRSHRVQTCKSWGTRQNSSSAAQVFYNRIGLSDHSKSYSRKARS